MIEPAPEQDLLALDELARYAAFLELYRSREPGPRGELRGILGGSEPLVKIALLEYLQDIPERRAVRLILPLLEDPNAEVRRAAGAAYKRSHFNGKNRILRPYVLSPRLEARLFAIRSLARSGDRDILPLLLRELPVAPEEVQEETLSALRALAEPAAMSSLVHFASSPREGFRYRALAALDELKGRGEPVPPEPFLARLEDPSDRVRRAALNGLRHYPSRRVTGLFLRHALDGAQSRRHRRRAIEALATFPQAEWVEPLLRVVEGEDGELRLAAEIALKRFPPRLLRDALFAAIDRAPRPIALQAALLLAETLGEDPEARARVTALWSSWTDLDSRLQLIEALRDLDDASVTPLLLGALKESPVLAYAAIGALNRLWTKDSGPRMLELLRDPELPQQARQALLSALGKRSPAPALRPALLEWLLGPGLGDEVLNIRYLSLQVLAWYPLEAKLDALLAQLGRSDNPEMAETARRQLAEGLGEDPRPLAAAWKSRPARALVGNLVAVLAARAWDPRCAAEALELLAAAGGLLDEAPFEFLTLALRFLERGEISFDRLWTLLRWRPQRMRFLGLLEAALKDPARSFPPLPLGLLADELLGGGEPARVLLYELAEQDGGEDAPRLLMDWLLRETGDAALGVGRRALSRMIWRPQ